MLRRLAQLIGHGFSGAALTPRTSANREFAASNPGRRSLRGVRERSINGIDDKGRPYNRMVWRRVQCANCGRHCVEIKSHYDGDPL